MDIFASQQSFNVQTFKSVRFPSHHLTLVPHTDDGLLLYGGLGSGGACAAGTTPATNTTHHPANTCDPLITDVGQIYRINIAAGAYHSPRLLEGNTGGGIESQYISGVTWEFARLTSSDGSNSAPGAPPSATEVLRTKSYALESVAYDPLRNILYEFGGLQASSVNLLSTNHQPTFDYSAVQAAANAGMDPTQQQYTAFTTNSAPLLKAGGQIPRMGAPSLQSDTTTGSSGRQYTPLLPAIHTLGIPSHSPSLVPLSTHPLSP